MKGRPTPTEERRKRRRELVIALAGVVLLAILFLFEARFVRSAEGIPFGGHMLLFGLVSIVTLLLILIIFFLIRNGFKLVFERRGRVLGSQLKTRLSLAFVALTLVPTIVLFIAGVSVVHTTIDSWFRTQVEDSLNSSRLIAQAYRQHASEYLFGRAAPVAAKLSRGTVPEILSAEEPDKELESLRRQAGVSALQLYFSDESPPLGTKDPELEAVPIPPPRPSFLRIGLKGGESPTTVDLQDGGALVRWIIPVRREAQPQVKSALIADMYIPPSLAGRLTAISNAYKDYQEAKRMLAPVKTIYVLILLLIALLVISIGSWFGVRVALDITEPIHRLATGTEKIAAGDLDVYIEPVADDELGVLVRSFNKMAADLRTNREDLIRINQDLESRRKYMETVLRNVAAGVLAVDAQGRITAVNRSSKRLLQITCEDASGLDWRTVMPEASAEALAEIMQELPESQTGSLERQISLSFGDRNLSLIVFANMLRDEEQRDLGAVLVIEDMTYLVKAQRMAAWRDVARRIAHEIKNPLTPIQLNAQRLRRKYIDRLAGDSEVLDRCTTAIVDQVEQLKAMVNEFSRFARMPSANPVPNDLGSLIEEVVRLYSQVDDGPQIVFTPDPTVPVLELDAEQIKRAVMNLLDNAVAAVPSDGLVKVETEYNAHLGIVSLTVADNGEGIRAADKNRLFEPYFSRKPGGTGLGLTIVSTIVTDHDGFIRVKDNDGGGSKFVIELPVKSGPRAVAASDAAGARESA